VTGAPPASQGTQEKPNPNRANIRVAETPEQFTFYGARTVAKVIEKSKFSSRQELLTFRRMVRRHVADNELLHD
jgi:hypothetical protein